MGRESTVPRARVRAHASPARFTSDAGRDHLHFVTDGIESALRQAKEAAAGKDILIGGGAETINQYLAAGLVDEINISIAPRFLGGGARLFDNLGDSLPRIEQTRVVDAPGVSHLRYRVSR